jgi:hypothetical protein
LEDFLIACRVIAAIRVKEGLPLAPPLISGAGKYVKDVIAERSGVMESWSAHGFTVTIPMKIEGDGKNFWID